MTDETLFNRMLKGNKMKNLIRATVIALYALPALACSPVPTTLESQIRAADVIFEGRVVEVTKPTAITFEVKRYWKGHPDQKIVVQTTPDTCGIAAVTPGQVMMIFAKGSPLTTTSVDGDFLIVAAQGQKGGDTKIIEDALGKGNTF